MGDKAFHVGLLIVTLAFWVMSGRVREHLWENIFPWVVMLALMVIRDAIVSAKALWKEVYDERRSRIRESGILLPSGQPATVITQSESDSYDGVKILGMTIILSVMVLLAVFLTWLKARTANTPSLPIETGITSQLQATEIYMGCTRIALPIHIAAGAVAHIKTFNKKQYGNTQSAMDDIHNDGMKEQLWPDEKIMKSGPKFNPGVFGYKCDVTNHATTNLIDLAIPLSTNFDNEKPALTYLAVVSPLDAGTTFSFYMINECPIDVSVIAPDSAAVQVFGEDKRRTVPLHWSHRNPIEQILMFFPSKVRWTGNVCE